MYIHTNIYIFTYYTLYAYIHKLKYTVRICISYMSIYIYIYMYTCIRYTPMSMKITMFHRNIFLFLQMDFLPSHKSEVWEWGKIAYVEVNP